MHSLSKLRTCFTLTSMMILGLWHSIPHIQQILMYLLLGLTCTFGLSHGALDWDIAKRRGLRKGILGTIGFIVCYVLISLLFMVYWWFFPDASFSIFLAISIWHFSTDWQTEVRPVLGLLLALSVIIAPITWYPSECWSIFNLFMPYHLSPNKIFSVGYLSYVVLPICLIGILLTKDINLYLEWSMLMILAYGLPPVMFFSLYFCHLHAFKHWMTYYDSKQHSSHIILITLLSVLLGIIIFVYFKNINLWASSLKIIFLELAALTIPHWILINVLTRK